MKNYQAPALLAAILLILLLPLSAVAQTNNYQVTNIRLSTYEDNIGLGWDAPKSFSKNVNCYALLMKKDVDFTEGDIAIIMDPICVPLGTTDYTFRNLNPATYYFKIGTGQYLDGHWKSYGYYSETITRTLTGLEDTGAIEEEEVLPDAEDVNLQVDLTAIKRVRLKKAGQFMTMYRASVAIKNIGSEDVTQPIYYSYQKTRDKYNTSQTNPGTKATLLASNKGLKAGETVVSSLYLPLSSSKKYFVLEVDPDNLVEETVEWDNSLGFVVTPFTKNQY